MEGNGWFAWLNINSMRQYGNFTKTINLIKLLLVDNNKKNKKKY